MNQACKKFHYMKNCHRCLVHITFPKKKIFIIMGNWRKLLIEHVMFEKNFGAIFVCLSAIKIIIIRYYTWGSTFYCWLLIRWLTRCKSLGNAYWTNLIKIDIQLSYFHFIQLLNFVRDRINEDDTICSSEIFLPLVSIPGDHGWFQSFSSEVQTEFGIQKWQPNCGICEKFWIDDKIKLW